MRKYAKALLLVFVALLYAGSASAYVVEVTGPSGSVFPSDVITVDVILDTEGAGVSTYWFDVYFDPTMLSAADGTQHLLPASDSSSLYESSDYWYITDIVFAGIAAPGVNMSIATLVFHVLDVPGSGPTSIVPVVQALADNLGAPVVPTVIPLALHVPEPTTTMLMGLGLLGILYAGRRR